MFEKYFPSGVAEGESFLGRKNELKRLKNNIAKGQHTLLLAPRRYGKTSLSKMVIHEVGLPSIEIDLFVAQNELSIEQKFIKGVQSILSKIDSPENWIQSLVKYFKKSNKTWTVGFKGLNLEIIPESYKDSANNILETLNALEHSLKEKGKSAIIFIDEFQEIADINNSRSIEGAIRHFAQSTKQVVFIFSGSNRHVLQLMFEDRSRPLYSLCDHIQLDRISSEEYSKYLNKLAVKTWKKKFENGVLERIFELTQCHPRYTYYFCFLLWEHNLESKSPPSIEDVNIVWDKLIESKLKDFRDTLNSKPVSHVKIMAYIALKNENITGQYGQGCLGISGSAIVQNLKSLEKNEYIEKIENGQFRIVDPVLRDIILKYGSDYFFSSR
jgi:predicted AAA+ superfamily ATPase